MSKFDEALGCCCCCCDDVDPQDHLREPDMSRYDNVINWTSKPKDLFGACDFEVEEMEDGIRHRPKAIRKNWYQLLCKQGN